jgi:undecaprenyl-diphosphatase
VNILQAIILGIVQGLTEFLPVSSSAHLTLAGKAMGVISPEHPEAWTAFIAVIQLGTLVAVLVYFARDIAAISAAFFRENLTERKTLAIQSLESRMGWFTIIGTVPIVTIGLVFKKIIEGNLTKSVEVIAGMMIAFALLLYLAERISKRERVADDLRWQDALLVGLAQTIALIPGASRSGTTITAGLLLGMTRETAARFSFLLSIPAVLASGLLQLRQALPAMNSQDAITITIATIVSGITGYLAIAWLLRYVQTSTMTVFVVYRVVLGVLLLTVLRAYV